MVVDLARRLTGRSARASDFPGERADVAPDPRERLSL
jgi:hypothetical protein